MPTPKTNETNRKGGKGATVEIADPKDYIQAVRRSGLYAQDFYEYEIERAREGVTDVYIGGANPMEPIIVLSQAGKKLCDKWGLTFPELPVGIKRPALIKAAEGQQEDAVREVDFLPDVVTRAITFPTVNDLKNPKTMQCYGVTGHDEFVTRINGKICLLVDMSYPPIIIKKCFNTIINRYGNVDKKRQKRMGFDPWEIYDLVIESNGKIAKAAQKYIGKEWKNVKTEKHAEGFYQMARRAYEKAKNMIASAEAKVISTQNRQ
jgi:hypothetical protein